ncbi:unnamed protein product, partial [Rotaria sp. Silwood1]
MSARVTPFNVSGLPTESATDQLGAVSEITVATVQGPTRDVMEYKITTNRGFVRGFEDKRFIENSNQVVAIVAEDDETKSRNQLIGAAAEDDRAKSNNQVTVPDQKALARAAGNQPTVLHATDFVPVPDLPVTSVTLPTDPYTFVHFQHYID